MTHRNIKGSWVILAKGHGKESLRRCGEIPKKQGSKKERFNQLVGSIEEIPINIKDNIGDVQGDEFEDLEVGICDT